jgi:tetratricopeptide (TPR) repeat protein
MDLRDQSEPTPSPRATPTAIAAGLSVALLAFLLYLVTLSPGAFPGESARTIAQFTGLDPLPAMTHTLWSLVARGLQALPVGSTSQKLNLLSAICGAACVWLLFLLVLRIEHDRTFEETMARFDRGKARLGSALFAALFLAVSLPFWVVSNRAHTAPFDLLILLATTHLLLRFAQGGRVSLVYAYAFVYAVGITEFATMILLAPLCGLMVLYQLITKGHLRVGVLAKAALCFLLGLSVYVLGAALYAGSPAYEWRGFKSFLQVLQFTWIEQYHLLTRGVPRIGWLTVLLVSFVPWLIVLGHRAPGRPVSSRGSWFGTYVLYGLLSAIALHVLFNGTVSPWHLTGLQPILVTPYLLTAAWAGYIAGFWYAMLSRRSRQGDRGPGPVRRALLYAYPVALAGVLGWACARNLPMADGRAARLCVRFANEVVDNLQGATWLVAGEGMHDDIAIVARERGQPLRMLNTAYAKSAAYLRYVASLFESPRLKSLAMVGMGPLLNEALVQRPEMARELAILNSPDIWHSGGKYPVPSGVLFLAEDEGNKPDPDELMSRHRMLWKDFAPAVATASHRGSLAQPWLQWIDGHLGKMANNLGVYFEDRGRPDLAFEAYRDARSVDTNNVSALINLHALAQRESRPELAGIEAELAALTKQQQGQQRVWALAYHHGYIRSPEAYARRGLAWAMTGKPNLALSDLRRALDLGAEDTSIQLVMAGIYFTDDMPEESRKAYLAVLEKDPDNRTSLLGLTRLAMRQGDLESARGYIGRLKELNTPAGQIRMEEALLEGLSGNPANAVKLLTELVRDKPENFRAWAALAVTATQVNDQKTLEQALEKLEAAKMVSPAIRLTMAQIALSRGDRAAARRHLEDLLKFQPRDVDALQMLLRFDVYEGQRDAAERHVESLLSADPRNAFGNYILGTIQVFNEQFALAESSYRVSLETERLPGTLNDLAWLLLRRGNTEEALKLIRESLALDDRNSAAWDTYGTLLLRLNDLQEAEKAFQKALALRPGSTHILLNTALLYEKKGLFKEALRVADGLMVRPAELSRGDYDDLRDLVKRLRAKT